jgi:hypothetical protein
MMTNGDLSQPVETERDQHWLFDHFAAAVVDGLVDGLGLTNEATLVEIAWALGLETEGRPPNEAVAPLIRERVSEIVRRGWPSR